MTTSDQQLLRNEFQHLMTRRMSKSLSKMMNSAEDALFEMATMGTEADMASHYIEAVREMRMKKFEIQVRFENRLANEFKNNVRIVQDGENNHYISKDDSDIHAPLSETGILEKQAIDKAEKKMKVECREALINLDQYVKKLMSDTDAVLINNPMQPGTVLDAFWDSCCDINTGSDVRMFLVDMFEKNISTDLLCLYEDLNTLLSSNSAISSSDTNYNMQEIGVRADESTSGLALVHNWVVKILEEKLSNNRMPDFVRVFILDHWGPHLGHIFETQGKSSPEWGRAIQVVEDLMFTTEPDMDRNKRRQQIWMLPGLIYRLKAGMKSISMPHKDRAEFLSKLKAYHSLNTDLSANVCSKL